MARDTVDSTPIETVADLAATLETLREGTGLPLPVPRNTSLTDMWEVLARGRRERLLANMEALGAHHNNQSRPAHPWRWDLGRGLPRWGPRAFPWGHRAR